jgi:hypothetical protein
VYRDDNKTLLLVLAQPTADLIVGISWGKLQVGLEATICILAGING